MLFSANSNAETLQEAVEVAVANNKNIKVNNKNLKVNKKNLKANNKNLKSNNKNLKLFLTYAKLYNMTVLLRPGPYVCA